MEVLVVIINEHKNGAATIRIFDDFCLDIDESRKLLEQISENTMGKLMMMGKTTYNMEVENIKCLDR